MAEPVHILHLEDNRADAELTAATLAGDALHCEIVCVETRDAFVAALRGNGSIILLSCFLPCA